MNINREHDSEEGLEEYEVENALEANEACMALVYDLLIEPMETKLGEKEHMVLGCVGMTFQEIARKAYQFEQIQKGENSQN
jgi:hypothetical protein